MWEKAPETQYPPILPQADEVKAALTPPRTPREKQRPNHILRAQIALCLLAAAAVLAMSRVAPEAYRQCGDAFRAAMESGVELNGQEQLLKFTSETVSGLGEVPVAPFAMPSTREVPESIRPFVAHHSAVLLANHGALAWGRDLWEAFDRMETVEQTAKIYAWVQLLGGGVELTREQTQGLLDLSGRYERLAGRREPGKED